MALHIAKLTGTNPEIWLSLQQRGDLQVAEKAMADALRETPALHG